MHWLHPKGVLWSVGLPLLVIAVLFYFAGVQDKDPANASLLINLSATAIGSFVTVFFIDVARRLDDERKWEALDKGISQEIVTAAAGAMTQIEAQYRRWNGVPPSGSITSIDAESLRFTRETVIPDLQTMLTGFNGDDRPYFVGDEWQALTGALDRISKSFESLHLLYQPRLGPEDLSQIQTNRVSAQQSRSLIESAPSLGIDPAIVTYMVAASVTSILRASMSLVSRHGSISGFDTIEATAER
jgi:hypothetical protein